MPKGVRVRIPPWAHKAFQLFIRTSSVDEKLEILIVLKIRCISEKLNNYIIMNEKSFKVGRIALLLATIYLFLVGIILLGSSFNLLGAGAANGLMQATSNPFAGLLIGILVTALVQSSSATTAMVVALVSTGALSITNAVPIIMGANIGTTVTNTIVSVGHITRKDEFERAYAIATVHDLFNVLAVSILLPLELLTGCLSKPAIWLAGFFYGQEGVSFRSPLKVITKPVANWILEIPKQWLPENISGIVGLVIAFLLIFLTLALLVKILRAIFSAKVEGSFKKIFSANPYLIILLGAAITALIQSSSLTTSFLVPLVGAGIITLQQAYPVTLGANIGTTATAILAALAGTQAGLAIAFVHLIFNISGIAIFFPIPFMRQIPVKMASRLASFAASNKKFAILFIIMIFFVLPLLGLFIVR